MNDIPPPAVYLVPDDAASGQPAGVLSTWLHDLLHRRSRPLLDRLNHMSTHLHQQLLSCDIAVLVHAVQELQIKLARIDVSVTTEHQWFTWWFRRAQALRQRRYDVEHAYTALNESRTLAQELSKSCATNAGLTRRLLIELEFESAEMERVHARSVSLLELMRLDLNRRAAANEAEGLSAPLVEQLVAKADLFRRENIAQREILRLTERLGREIKLVMLRRAEFFAHCLHNVEPCRREWSARIGQFPTEIPVAVRATLQLQVHRRLEGVVDNACAMAMAVQDAEGTAGHVVFSLRLAWKELSSPMH